MQSTNNSSPPGSAPGLPDLLTDIAVFLDIDGTLIDIAETPESVVVPPDLPSNLEQAAAIASGALAVVSGRSIDNIDFLLTPAKLTAVGLHGTEFRHPDGEVEMLPPPAILGSLRPALTDLVAAHPGARVEDKGRAIAIHYRGAPDAEVAIREAVESFAAKSDGELKAQHGKMVIELKPANAGKGVAVDRLMTMPPFEGRTPIAVGDDVTDEEMFEAVNRIGGWSFRVGTPDRPTAAKAYIDDTNLVREWLAALRPAKDRG